MKAEARQDLPRARLERVAAELVEARLRVPEALDEILELVGARGVGHRVLERVQLVGRLGHLARAGHRLRDHAPALHLADVLAEVADGHAAIDRDLPASGCFLLHDHPEDGRLARAVRPDEADLLAFEGAHRGVEEEDLLAVLLGDLVETDHEASCVAAIARGGRRRGAFGLPPGRDPPGSTALASRG